MNRFLLDLQEASQRDVKLASDDPLHSSRTSFGSLNFARVMGSMGETISGGSVREDEDLTSDGDIETEHTGVSDLAQEGQGDGQDGGIQEVVRQV